MQHWRPLQRSKEIEGLDLLLDMLQDIYRKTHAPAATNATMLNLVLVLAVRTLVCLCSSVVLKLVALVPVM
jgi:hypothetical protein